MSRAHLLFRATALRVSVKQGQLVIAIGVETLAFAFENSPYANPWDDKACDYVRRLKVADVGAFAVDVAYELKDEEEDGTTLVHALLDRACQAAAENGSQGVEEL